MALSVAGFGQYQYYYDESFSTWFFAPAPQRWNPDRWTKNGTINSPNNNPIECGNNCLDNYIVFGGGNLGEGSLISTFPVPDGSSDYEAETQFLVDPVADGALYIQFLRAPPDLGGNFYSVEFQNPGPFPGGCSGTLVLNIRLNGITYAVNSAIVSCPNNSITIRSVLAAGNQLLVYANGVSVFQYDSTAITTGQAGLGMSGARPGVGVYRMRIGPRDRIAPNNTTMSASPNWNRVDLQWPAASDDANGSGVAFYRIARNGVFQAEVTTLSYADTTVSANTVYTYTITTHDQHLNASTGSSTVVTTLPNPAIDTPPTSGATRPFANPPARIGVRPTGAYWGAAGEQVDMLSGNLNYTLPLLKAMGRGGSIVGFSLNYNSQIWRLDGGGTWNFGIDVGYGFGWRLMAGSITPYWSNYTLHHYVFTDATGAEYTLGVNTNGVWTSTEGIYLSYDTSNAKLSFPDGTFWMMLAVSSAQEPDGGTHYPTLIQDTNGNQIKITYHTGSGMSWINTSSRISVIEDVRAKIVYPYSDYRTFTFNYNTDSPPHLISITNQISTGETYSFAYAQNQSISSPFGAGPPAITVALLQTVTNSVVSMSHNFEYSGGAAELSRVVLPYGATLRWAYRNFTFSGPKTIREVQYRYLAKSAGFAETQYAISRNANDSNLGWHSSGALTDATGAIKNWTFNVSPTSWLDGMLLSYNQQQPGGAVTLRSQDFIWGQTPASFNPYITSAITTLDPGAAYQKQSKTEQALDAYGNVVQTKIYDFGSGTTVGALARTYNNSYVTGANYESRNIRNRLFLSTVTAGAQTVQLVSIGYDGGVSAPLPSDPPIRQHDTANYGTSFVYRGNVSTTTTPTASYSFARLFTGDVVSGSGPSGVFTSTPTSVTNYAAPSVITSNNLSTTLTYNNFLGVTQATGQNTESVTVGYDLAARPSQTTSPHGAVTTYSYSIMPNITTVVVNNRWTMTTLDGLGRPIQVETTGDGTKVETEYDSCACSPVGKMKRVSQPYAPGGQKYWTTYTYDGLGRTVSVQAPDGASATTYSYQGNTTTITDPAGKWKKYVNDALGNLIRVIEPGS